MSFFFFIINCLCLLLLFLFFFFKQKTAYYMRISDWSADVCSSDLLGTDHHAARARDLRIEGRRGREPRGQGGRGVALALLDLVGDTEAGVALAHDRNAEPRNRRHMTGGLDQLAVRIGLGLGRKQTVDEQQFLVERHLGHDRERPRSCLAYVGRRRGGGNRHRGKRGRLLRGKRHRRPKQQDRDRESPWPIDQRKLPLVATRRCASRPSASCIWAVFIFSNHAVPAARTPLDRKRLASCRHHPPPRPRSIRIAAR